MVHVELIESPQRDWWVVADGRVIHLYLAGDECPDPFAAALKRGKELSKPYGLSILGLGTTWRSMAFDHLEELSCLRGACCRAREMDYMEDENGSEGAS